MAEGHHRREDSRRSDGLKELWPETSAILGAAWPLPTVVLLHALGARLFGHTQGLDVVMHTLGGAAVAWCAYRLSALRPAAGLLGILTSYGRASMALGATALVALGWELAEFGLDRYRHTHIQVSLAETLLDLSLGITGAVILLIFSLSAQRFSESQKPQ